MIYQQLMYHCTTNDGYERHCEGPVLHDRARDQDIPPVRTAPAALGWFKAYCGPMADLERDRSGTRHAATNAGGESVQGQGIYRTHDRPARGGRDDLARRSRR